MPNLGDYAPRPQQASPSPVVAAPGHLLAERAVSGQQLFTPLPAPQWGWTVRLRVPLPVTADGVAPTGRDRLRQARATGWTVGHAAYGQGRKALPAPLVVGRGLGVLPRHQHPAGSLRAWAQRQSVFHQVVAKAVRP